MSVNRSLCRTCRGESLHMRKIILVRNALPTPLFSRLVRAVHAVGTERLKQNGSYMTTFWFSLGAKPSNIAEEAIVRSRPLIRPGPKCGKTSRPLQQTGKDDRVALDLVDQLLGQTVQYLPSVVITMALFTASCKGHPAGSPPLAPFPTAGRWVPSPTFNFGSSEKIVG